MSDTITLRGWVGTDPTKGNTRTDRTFSRFRLAVSDGYFDRDRQAWVNFPTSWYDVSCYGELAENVAASVRKGQRVIVMGRLGLRTFQRKDGTFGTEAEISAVAVGQDLALGLGTWNRRRDEPQRLGEPDGATLIEGIGAVDPVTGEVGGADLVDDPFVADPSGFEDQGAFDGVPQAGAEQRLLTA